MRLSQIITPVAEGLLKKQPTAEQTMEQLQEMEFQRLYDEEVSRTRLPRGTVEIAAAHLKSAHSLDDAFDAKRVLVIQNIDAKSNIDIYKRVVKDRFHSLRDTAMEDAKKKAEKEAEKKCRKGKGKKKLQEDPEQAGKGDVDGSSVDNDEEDELEKEKEKLRTCTVSLQSILRDDLAHMQDQILECLEGKQSSLTDDIAELSALIQKAILSVSH